MQLRTSILLASLCYLYFCSYSALPASIALVMGIDLQAILTHLQSLPAEANPFLALEEVLYEPLLPRPKSYFQPVLRANQAVAAIGILCTLLVIVLKSAHKGGWLYRKRATVFGDILAPNTTLLISIFCLVYYICALVMIQYLIDAFVHRHSPVPYQAMQGLIWSPVIFVLWTTCYGTSVSTFLSMNSTRQTTRGRKSFRSSISIPAWLLNFCFVAFYPIYFILAMVMFGLATQKVRLAWTNLETVIAIIDPLAADWQIGQAFELPLSALPPIKAFGEAALETANGIGHGFIVHTIFLLLGLVIFLPSSILYIRMLHFQINAFSLGMKSQTASVDVSSPDSELRSLRNTYRAMQLETMLVSLAALFFTALAFWISVDTRSALANAAHVNLLFSLALSSFTFLTVPMNMLILYRTMKPIWQQRSRLSSSRGTHGEMLSAGIRVQTVTAIHIDDAQWEAGYAIAELQIPTYPQSPRTPTRPTVVSFDVSDKDKYESSPQSA